MARTDYLLRMIEMVGRMLAELRRMILGGHASPGESDRRLRDVASRAGLDLDLLRSVDPDTLVMLMSPAGEPEPGRCWTTAELLLVDGERCRAEGDAEGARECWRRALRLYALLDPGIIARGFPEVRDRIAELRELVDSLDEEGPDG